VEEWKAKAMIISFFFYLRKLQLLESVLYGSRWVNKTLAVPGSYKRCISWLELETYCADLKSFCHHVITYKDYKLKRIWSSRMVLRPVSVQPCRQVTPDFFFPIFFSTRPGSSLWSLVNPPGQVSKLWVLKVIILLLLVYFINIINIGI